MYYNYAVGFGGSSMGSSFRAAVLAAAALAVTFATIPSDAKKWTIYERQVKLNQEIAQGLKSGDLTDKEATKLKDEAANISERIQKSKDKNAGKISVPDETKIEKDLNKLSLNIQKKKLQKRVQ
jgi:septal ring factor EnvC (AmiA/AmiB activator)